ncbi:hypothetical protein [Actinopolyspora saharensis]|uniref:hypothetical protein n=1 Tax=Actinopolyspora saharensis TaxID=995062 RepID=UPI003F671C92
MLEDRLRLRMDEFGHLHENHTGQIGESVSPVLATPAAAGAFAGGAALVTAAYGAGHAVG